MDDYGRGYGHRGHWDREEHFEHGMGRRGYWGYHQFPRGFFFWPFGFGFGHHRGYGRRW